MSVARVLDYYKNAGCCILKDLFIYDFMTISSTCVLKRNDLDYCKIMGI